MSFVIPTITAFKDKYARDFPFGTTSAEVNDSDIQSAIDDAGINFNESLWASQASFNSGYLALTAHYLVMNLRNSSQGISGGFQWLTQSKAVGSINESFAIPQRILDNPMYAMLSKTSYGAKYLQLVWPQLKGVIYTVTGVTQP